MNPGTERRTVTITGRSTSVSAVEHAIAEALLRMAMNRDDQDGFAAEDGAGTAATGRDAREGLGRGH
jgi:hypothetical protein